MKHIVARRCLLRALATAFLLMIVASAATASCRYPNCGEPVESCVGNTRHVCNVQTNVDTEECPAGSTCVEGERSYGRYAVCAIGGQRHPRCDPDSDRSFCQGERIESCRGAYVEREEDCTANGLVCETIVGGSAPYQACVLSHQPDPRCADGHFEARTVCDGDLIVACTGAFARRVYGPCSKLSPGRSCVNGRCVLP